MYVFTYTYFSTLIYAYVKLTEIQHMFSGKNIDSNHRNELETK